MERPRSCRHLASEAAESNVEADYDLEQNILHEDCEGFKINRTAGPLGTDSSFRRRQYSGASQTQPLVRQ